MTVIINKKCNVLLAKNIFINISNLLITLNIINIILISVLVKGGVLYKTSSFKLMFEIFLFFPVQLNNFSKVFNDKIILYCHY